MVQRLLKCLASVMLIAIMVAPIGADRPITRFYGQVQSQVGQNLVTEVKGKLKGFEQGLLIVTREDGTDIQVQPPDEAQKFQFVAEASPRFLQQGMLVRFQGTFNQSGVAQSPIAKVELFQPVQGKVPGHLRKRYYPGVYTNPKEAKQNAATGIAKCSVVGTLVGIDQSGMMRVRAGKVPVQIPLVPNVKFEIRYHDLSLAQPGDPIRVSGFYNPPDETKVKADTATVTTDRVLGEYVPEESPAKPKRRVKRRTRRKPADTESPIAAETETPTAAETESPTEAKPEQAGDDDLGAGSRS